MAAIVSNNMVRLFDCEGSPTFTSIGSGQVASPNTDIYIQGTQSVGRRSTSTGTPTGSLVVSPSVRDASLNDSHVGVWVWVTHYQLLSQLNVVLSSDSTDVNTDRHSFPLINYPEEGGWVRIWLDVSRTPQQVTGIGLDETLLRSVGTTVAFTQTPGGTTQNLCIDSADLVNQNVALIVTGANALFSQIADADSAPLNQYGCFRDSVGTYRCFARTQFGTVGSPIQLTESNFTLVFPRQPLVSDTFMGMVFNLQNASTNIQLDKGSISSTGTPRGDFIVDGDQGVLSITDSVLTNIRRIDLTSSTAINGCRFSGCGPITVNGATIQNCSISGSLEQSAVICSNDIENITSTRFTSDGTGNAIEITSPGEYTISALQFSDYDVTGQPNAAIRNNSGGEVILNISDTLQLPTYYNVGSSTTIVRLAPVSVTLNNLITNSEVRAYVGTDPETSVEIAAIENSATSFSFEHTSFGEGGYIQIFNVNYIPITLPITYAFSDVSLTIQQVRDRQYI